jgi:glyoxylase-like metal-dependent hydrolase (beta-lactamase superfamily II)
MKIKIGGLLAVAVLTSGQVAPPDARSFLQAADRAMGASAVNAIQLTGSGWYAAVGQSYASDEDWPRVDLKSYSLTIDYRTRSAREESVLVQGENEPQGGGRQPIVGERRTVNLVNANTAWTLSEDDQPVAQPGEAEVRQFMLWTTPHGFIKAALQSNNATVVDRYLAMQGRTLKVVGFTTMNKYRVTGEFNDQTMLLERVVTWIPNPVMGDSQVEIRYTDYRDVGNGVKYPFRYHGHQGDHPLLPVSTGRNWMDYRVTDVKLNIPNAATPIPPAVRNAPAPQNEVTAERLGDGIWLMSGGSHNSIAIAFRDFVAVVEAPLDGARSEAVIAEIKRVIPGKPIRYLVNTHHHFDHLGGARTYAAEGATVITHNRNRELYERVVFAPQPRTLLPDRLSQFPFATTGPLPVMLEFMWDRHAISDGERSLLLFHVQELNHVETMLVAYLPEERLLINADLYSPPAAGTAPPANVSQGAIALYNTVQRLRLEVSQHVPIHGRPGPHADFERIVGPAAREQVAGGGGG